MVQNSPPYFSNVKMTEIHELKQLLNYVSTDRQAYTQQRDAIQKVIALMTLGVDVSHLFSEMVIASNTSDVVQKKMIYLYMSTYSESNPDLCLLAINTLQRDCTDHDPVVRGLALKSLCSLNVSNTFEYLEPAVRRALSDTNGYVRSTAVMGILRIFHIFPETVIGNLDSLDFSHEEEISNLYEIPSDPSNEPLLRILFALLNDIQPNVVCNAIFVLNEILAAHGGLPVTRKLVIRLLNRIKQFRDASQCLILNIVSQYVPANEDEVYDIMNILEDQLRHSTPAILLATTRCFLALTNYCTHIRFSVIKRLRAPFLTFLTAASPELNYVLLTHLKYLLTVLQSEYELNEAQSSESSIGTRVFGHDYRLFFLCQADPIYIKLLKIDLLTMIASQDSVPSILDELAEYTIMDRDLRVSEKAIEGMGRLGLQFPPFRQSITVQILQCMDVNLKNVSSCFSVLRHFVKEDSEIFDQIKDIVQEKFLTLTNPAALAPCLWMLGELFDNFVEIHPLKWKRVEFFVTLGNYGVDLPNTPYLLEDFVTKTFTENETSSTHHSKPTRLKIKSNMNSDELIFELITTTTRVFLVRPAETQKTCGRLFCCLLDNDEISFDARDRVLFLYRFLRELSLPKQSTLATLKSLFKPLPLQNDSPTKHQPPLLKNFYQLHPEDLEFNTLALIFGSSPSHFLQTSKRIPLNGKFLVNPSFGSHHSTNNASPARISKKASGSKHEEPIIVLQPLLLDTQQKQQKDNEQLSVQSNSEFFHENLSTLQQEERLTLIEDDQELLDPVSFEELWMKLPVAYRGMKKKIQFDSELIGSAEKFLSLIRQNLSECKFYCIASGSPSPNFYKFFSYAMSISPLRNVILMECQFSLNPDPTFLLEIKIDPPETLDINLILDWFRRSTTVFSSFIPS